MNYAVKFLSDTVGYGEVRLSGFQGVEIPQGVCAVVGPNGSGKTTLGQALEIGRYGFGNKLSFAREGMTVKMIAFTDIHSLTGIHVARHDQRLEASENELVPTVGEIIARQPDPERFAELCEVFALTDVADKKVNYLSSGELRKMLLINTLLSRPDILVLDNPYIGLDAHSRGQLDVTLKAMAETGLTIVLLLCDPAEIPDYTNSVIVLNDCKLEKVIEGNSYPSATERINIDPRDIPAHRSEYPCFEVAFSITDGHLKYGDRVVLEGIDWCVKGGERWALTGPNGSGKSLLLSYVCADHPQAYANDIVLFDRRRGTGESIWEIKDKIGYSNPEMQLYFKSPLPVEQIVAQGLRSPLDRYRKLEADELREARTWLGLLGIEPLSDRKYQTLSSGQQRMVLLAAALIKQPPLLILDEPLHGLDPENKQRILQIVNAIEARSGRSLIFVSHYLNEIPSCVTHTFTLKK